METVYTVYYLTDDSVYSCRVCLVCALSLLVPGKESQSSPHFAPAPRLRVNSAPSVEGFILFWQLYSLSFLFFAVYIASVCHISALSLYRSQARVRFRQKASLARPSAPQPTRHNSKSTCSAAAHLRTARSPSTESANYCSWLDPLSTGNLDSQKSKRDLRRTLWARAC